MKSTYTHIIRFMAVLMATSSLAAQTQSAQDTQQYQSLIQQFSSQPITIKSVKDTPVNGIKELVIQSNNSQTIVYVSADGEYLLEGNLMNLKNRQNLTEMSHSSLRLELLNEFKKTHNSIDFLPEQMTDHITVFTDIDCGYCRKLHQELEQYNELGIGVSYLFFPRAGLNSPSHQKAVNVWCADDQHDAMTAAKNGQELPPLMCPNPIESQFNLGLKTGIHKIGTPAVVLGDGSITGYLPAVAMKQKITATKPKQQ